MSAPTPSPDLSRERERDRLLTLANVQRVRGQLPEAQKTLRDALALGGEATAADAPIHEMLGDLLGADGKWDEAKAAYATAHALDPARVAAERKLAQAALHVAEAAQARALADAVLRGEALPSAVGGSASSQGKRSPAMAMFFSAVIPGAGQLYNGQTVKGLLCIAVTVITLLAIWLVPGGALVLDQIVSMIVPGAKKRLAPGEAPPFVWFLVLLSAVVWLYSVLDAPTVAAKMSDDRRRGGVPPEGDRSGWEV